MPTKSESHCTNIAVGSVFYFDSPLNLTPDQQGTGRTSDRVSVSLCPIYIRMIKTLCSEHSLSYISATKLI